MNLRSKTRRKEEEEARREQELYLECLAHRMRLPVEPRSGLRLRDHNNKEQDKDSPDKLSVRLQNISLQNGKEIPKIMVLLS